MEALVMAFTNESSDRRALDRLPALSKPAERDPLIPPPAVKKKRFVSLAFRGLGCASSSTALASAPADGKRSGGGRRQRRENKERDERRRNRVADDAWCAPGIAFAAEAAADSVVDSHRRAVQRPERIHRERPCFDRRISREERMPSFMDSPPTLGAPFSVSDIVSSGRYHRYSGYHHGPPEDFEEAMMERFFLGRMTVYDRFKDLRLDVDHMSYEELLELGDRIGYVSNGLREEEILRNLHRSKYRILEASRLHASTECKCSICQEEYEVRDELGKLHCGHSYHMCCIKEWLLQKNACPMCKTAVSKT